MPEITWDGTGKRLFETGVDHAVLYLPDNTGLYKGGVPWNGITTITESPSGADANAQYADNIKYLNLQAAEEFGFTLEAFTYPAKFEACDGIGTLVDGVYVAQQGRALFGLSYRTLVGNDLVGTDFGYKLHLVYGALASPSEKARATVNDSPEAAGLSWECTTTALAVGTVGGKAYKPTSHVVVDSTVVDADALEALEDLLYSRGSETDATLPAPADVYALFADVTP